jgi:hypothetical protein
LFCGWLIATAEARTVVTPYSKSHARRTKKKDKSQLTASLGEVHELLEEMLPEEPAAKAAQEASLIKPAPKDTKLSRNKRNRLLSVLACSTMHS